MARGTINYLAEYESQTRDGAPTKGRVPWYMDARWKGIPFHVESTSDEFGRRGDVYEFPLGEDTAYKDLGRRAERFKVEGYLIGSNQVQLSQQMRTLAMSPEPGQLDHPLFGTIVVALVTLTMTADYRRDKKRTKLAFEFVEAGQQAAPLETGKTIGQVWEEAAKAIEQAKQSMDAAAASLQQRYAGSDEVTMIDDMSNVLAGQLPQMMNIGEALQQGGTLSSTQGIEQIMDARDMLSADRYAPTPNWAEPIPVAALGARAPGTLSGITPTAASASALPSNATFRSLIAPIDYASSVIREFQTDALQRLRDFNRYVVSRQEATPMAQWLVITVRLIILRDFATAAARKDYETIRDASDDLDFIISAYDDEEALATQNCDDVLVSLIYAARAAAIAAILSNNVRLPGVAEFPVDGVWPSVVVAWKLYADSRRHEQVESYNPSMLPFWMGRDVIAPAR